MTMTKICDLNALAEFPQKKERSASQKTLEY
jgi:hypothetical protein